MLAYTQLEFDARARSKSRQIFLRRHAERHRHGGHVARDGPMRNQHCAARQVDLNYDTFDAIALRTARGREQR